MLACAALGVFALRVVPVSPILMSVFPDRYLASAGADKVLAYVAYNAVAVVLLAALTPADVVLAVRFTARLSTALEFSVLALVVDLILESS